MLKVRVLASTCLVVVSSILRLSLEAETECLFSEQLAKLLQPNLAKLLQGATFKISDDLSAEFREIDFKSYSTPPYELYCDSATNVLHSVKVTELSFRTSEKCKVSGYGINLNMDALFQIPAKGKGLQAADTRFYRRFQMSSADYSCVDSITRLEKLWPQKEKVKIFQSRVMPLFANADVVDIAAAYKVSSTASTNEHQTLKQKIERVFGAASATIPELKLTEAALMERSIRWDEVTPLGNSQLTEAVVPSAWQFRFGKTADGTSIIMASATVKITWNQIECQGNKGPEKLRMSVTLTLGVAAGTAKDAIVDAQLKDFVYDCSASSDRKQQISQMFQGRVVSFVTQELKK